MNLDLATPMTAALSVSLLGYTGVSTVMRVWHEPPIVGAAAYSEPVFAGETVMLQWTFHKRSECTGSNSRVWDGEKGFHMTEAAKRNTLPVTAEPISPVIPTDIPREAPPGELRLTIVGECDFPQAAPVHFSLGPVVFQVEAPE